MNAHAGKLAVREVTALKSIMRSEVDSLTADIERLNGRREANLRDRQRVEQEIIELTRRFRQCQAERAELIEQGEAIEAMRGARIRMRADLEADHG